MDFNQISSRLTVSQYKPDEQHHNYNQAQYTQRDDEDLWVK